MTTPDLATYEQVVAFQTSLVNRAVLQRDQVHEIDHADETAYGSVWLHCTCGHWTSFKSEDADRGERVYISHVAFELRSRLARAA